MEKQTWCKQKTALLKTDESHICVRVQQIIRRVSRLKHILSWIERSRSLDKKAHALASPPPRVWCSLPLTQKGSEQWGCQRPQKISKHEK